MGFRIQKWQLLRFVNSITAIGFRLISSGLHLDFRIPPETAPHEALIKAFQTLTLKTDEFSNVNPDFTAKIPVVSFNVGGKTKIMILKSSWT